MVDALSAIVRLRARQNNIAYQTLATHGTLAEVARGHEDVDILQGWKREIVGNDLLAFLDGKIELSAEGGRLVLRRKAGA